MNLAVGHGRLAAPTAEWSACQPRARGTRRPKATSLSGASLLGKLNLEDRLIVASMVIPIGGIVVGALLAEPRAFGVDAFIVMALLIVGRFVTRSRRLAWLLPFRRVVGAS